jgi:lipopolysaccharide/colanic/teichoic acid biosynthesis glycosyltransferase
MKPHAFPHLPPTGIAPDERLTLVQPEPLHDPWMELLQVVQDEPSVVSRAIYVYLVKRVLDIIASAILIALIAPMLVVIALAMMLDSGRPILFRQTRVGLGNRRFTVYKFRTMIDDRRQSLAPIGFPERRQRHKSEDDPRVTRVGRILRKTSLDELPQLFNVLIGDMSLVGPRPELIDIVETYEPWQFARHLVRPGITGWWQVNGRSLLPMHQSTHLDLYYVQRVSFWLDARILLRTLPAVFRRSGAF